MKKLHNTEELDELLGGELNLDQAWSEFNKDKKKTRRLPFWWCFGLGSSCLLGVLGVFMYLNIQEQQTTMPIAHSSIYEKIAKPSLQLLENKENNTSTVVSSWTNKEISNTTPLKTTPILVKKKRQTVSVSTPSLEKNSDLTKKVNQVSKTPIKSLNQVVTFPSSTEDQAEQRTIREVKSIATLAFGLTLQQEETISIVNKPHKVVNFPKWSIGLQYAWADANRTISGGQEAYTKRRQEEQFLESNRIAILATRNLSNSLFLQTGFTLTQYRSKLVEEIQTITSPINYENVVIETHTQNNLTQELIGVAQGSQLAINRYTRYQRYQTFSIPLRFGVRFPIGSYWHLTASSGIAFSLYGQAKGFTISSTSPDGTYIPLEQLNYVKTGLLEGMGQLNIERSFGKTILSIGVQGNADLTNRFRNNVFGKDKFRGHGLHFGFRRAF